MDALRPAAFNNQANSAAPDQDLVQDTFNQQQLHSRGTGSDMAAKHDLSPGATQMQGVCDGEEKRDQSKEEPPLEMKQQEGSFVVVY